MKSAYELAMERMGEDDEPKPISKEQKAEIAQNNFSIIQKLLN